MPSSDSDTAGKVVGMPSEQLVGIGRNEWTASVGIGGRHGPDYATLMGEKLKPFSRCCNAIDGETVNQ
jgi:hypothetical protein